MKNEKPVSIIFMGTPEFAVPTLEILHKEFCVKAVVTLPDKPQGRGQILTPSDVKVKGLELGIPVLQPVSLNDELFIEQIKALEPDIIVVVAFRILPPSVFNLASTGSFNIHASLLPAYRGAAPINWAIIRGEKITGLTSFLLNEKVDTGSILLQKEVPIPEGATAGELHDMLMAESPGIAVETVRLLLKGDFHPLLQDNSKATPAPKIFPENCRINWNENSTNVRNFIHGMSPYPGAWTDWRGNRLKILSVEANSDSKGNPGLFKIENGKFVVWCGAGSVLITKLQMPGKKAISTKEFLAGYRGEKTGNFNII